MSKPDDPSEGRVLSVVIKALNEERNIDRTLASVRAAVEGLDAEVVLADSVSTDRTVEIARRYPVTIVQLAHPSERCCGIAAQLGYQHTTGRYVLVMDGDMELDRGWLLAAIERLDSSPDLAGVGGLLDDINLSNIEFRARAKRRPADQQAGRVPRLDGGGLFRRAAIESIGYLTNRNLHACEELEQGMRLTAQGWSLVRLDRISTRHHGHTDAMWALIRRRWRSRYVDGAGELVRASIGQPWFFRAIWHFKRLFAVIAWWIAMAAIAGLVMAGRVDPRLGWAVPALLIFPFAVMVIRKRSVALGAYSVLIWCIEAAGLLRGLAKSQVPPLRIIDSRVVSEDAVVRGRAASRVPEAR